MDDEEEGNKSCPLVICFISEFFGTGILLFMGCMSCLWEYGMGPTIPAFAFGLNILAIVQTFGHITPVHINPAVSVAMLIMGKMHWKQVLVYIAAQYTGALAGMYLLTLSMPYAPNLGLLQINFNITELQGFSIEFAATFVLFMTVTGIIHPRNASHHDSTPARIGLMITGLVFSSASFTGAGLNPARALAPVLVHGEFKDVWVYQLAPFAGMATAAILSRFVLDPEESKSLYRCVQKKGASI